MRMEKTRKYEWLAAALIIIIGFAVYANSLRGQFIWDDDTLIKENVLLRSWNNIGRFFTTDIANSGGTLSSSYRPLQMISYTADYSFWKLNVFGYHLTNILLHILAALGIYALIAFLFKNKLLGWITGILFAVHPIHTEAVAYISGRADILSLLFILSCFLIYLQPSYFSHRMGIRLAIIFLIYSAALLSYEGSLGFPLLLLVYHFSFNEKIKWREFITVLTAGAAYIILRVSVIKLFIPVTFYVSFLERLSGFFAAVTNYIRLLLLPLNLHMEYGIQWFSYANPQVIIGMLIVIAGMIVFWKQRGKGDKLVSFAVGWFFIGLIPVANIIYPIHVYMAEHWLYLPSIGFFLLAAKAIMNICRRKNQRPLIIGACVGLLCFYGYLTIKQNVLWRDPVSFYLYTLKYAPNSQRVHHNLGIAYRELEQYDKAIASFEKSIETAPNVSKGYQALADIYFKMDKYDEAAAQYDRVIALNDRDGSAYCGRGVMYMHMNKQDEAIASFKKAIELNPDFSEAYNNLANVYASDKKFEEAAKLYKKAMQIQPRDFFAMQNLMEMYKKIIESSPKDANARFELGTLYMLTGKNKEAMDYYKTSLELAPDNAELRNNMGILYMQTQKWNEAIAAYEQALKIDPQFAAAHNNLADAYYTVGKYAPALEHAEKASALGYKVDQHFLSQLRRRKGLTP